MKKESLSQFMNMIPSPSPQFYFWFKADSEDEMIKYYEYLREVEKITSDCKNGKNFSNIKVQISTNPSVNQIPSKLGNCFRCDDVDNSPPWYEFSSINNTHWLVKLKKIPSMCCDDLIKRICDTHLIYEDDNVLVVKYNFAINS